MTTFTLNGEIRTVDTDPETPVLWVIREQLDLTGTKFGCGMAQCGACTIHVNGRAQRACITPIASLEGASITTIEGLKVMMDRFMRFSRRGLITRFLSAVTVSRVS